MREEETKAIKIYESLDIKKVQNELQERIEKGEFKGLSYSDLNTWYVFFDKLILKAILGSLSSFNVLIQDDVLNDSIKYLDAFKEVCQLMRYDDVIIKLVDLNDLDGNEEQEIKDVLSRSSRIIVVLFNQNFKYKGNTNNVVGLSNLQKFGDNVIKINEFQRQ